MLSDHTLIWNIILVCLSVSMYVDTEAKICKLILDLTYVFLFFIICQHFKTHIRSAQIRWTKKNKLLCDHVLILNIILVLMFIYILFCNHIPAFVNWYKECSIMRVKEKQIVVWPCFYSKHDIRFDIFLSILFCNHMPTFINWCKECSNKRVNEKQIVMWPCIHYK